MAPPPPPPRSSPPHRWIVELKFDIYVKRFYKKQVPEELKKACKL
jgi:hypothetical protein